MKRLVFALTATGCAPAVAPPAHLAVHAVEWNPAHADVGHVTAVADRGAEVVVFSDGAATVFDSGAVRLVDRSVAHWTNAATVPAADGRGEWIVGIDASGRVRRLRDRAGFEDVSARWGLDGAAVLGAAASGAREVVFLVNPSRPAPGAFARELALADGARVSRFGGVYARAVAASGGVVAALTPEGIARVVTSERGITRVFPLGGEVTGLAVDDAGKVYAATPDAVYAEDETGTLVLKVRAALGPIHGLLASKGRVWFVEGSELGTFERGIPLATTGAKLSADARVWPSTSGDVWLLSGGRLSRFAREEPRAAAPPGASWTRDLQPVFARACAKCHLQGGPAGLDLSDEGAWQAHARDVRERVLDEKTMPPAGSPLSDEDRETIRQWLGSH